MSKVSFANAKVGDLVFSVRNQSWTRILCIMGNDCEYPIRVSSPGGNSSYTIDGKHTFYDKFPTLFPADQVPDYYLEYCPRPKFKVKKTIERWVYVQDETIEGEVCFLQPCDVIGKGTWVKVSGEYEVEE